MAMTKSQIQSTLGGRNRFEQTEGRSVVGKLAELACKEAANGFTLPGLGKLVLVDRAARMGRNPATGETIQIPAKKVVKFRIAKACKTAILGE